MLVQKFEQAPVGLCVRRAGEVNVPAFCQCASRRSPPQQLRKLPVGSVVRKKSTVFPRRDTCRNARWFLNTKSKARTVHAIGLQPVDHPLAIRLSYGTQNFHAYPQFGQAAGRYPGPSADLASELTGERLLPELGEGSEFAKDLIDKKLANHGNFGLL